VELYNRDGELVVIDPAGRLTPVNLAGLRELIARSICGVRVVKDSTGWRREYFEYPFATRPHPGAPRAEDHGKPPAVSREPDATVLDALYRHESLWRIPRVE
jgi:hypothetical protein